MRKYLWISLILVCLAVIYVIANVVAIVVDSKTDETQNADAIIVLGAGVSGEEPTPVFRERINHAVWLYQSDYAPKVIFTGGYSGGNKISDAAIAKVYAMKCGIPEETILLEEALRITQENLHFARQIMKENQLHTALIVSDPLHMKRAMKMAEDEGIEAYASPSRTSRYRSLRTQIPFVARETFFYIGYKAYRVFMPVE